MDLVKMILNEFTGDNVERLGSQVGASAPATRSAIEAAVPTILSSLAGLAASDDGAKKLSSTLGGLDLGKISSLASMFGDSSGTASRGGNLLTSLLGDNLISSVSSSIGNYSGLNGSIVKKILAFAMPFILGKIFGAWQSKGGTTNALQRLFVDQQDNISDAVPSGFSLASIPGLPSAEGVVRAVGRGANEARAAVRDTTRHVADTSRHVAAKADNATRSILSWLLPLAALLLAALGLWYIFGPGRAARNAANNTVDRTRDATRDAADAARSGAERITALRPTLPDVPDIDVMTKGLTGTFTSANRVLTGIKDAASAEAALPQLTKMSTEIDDIRAQLDKLPAAGQTALGKLVGEKFGPFQAQVKRILALPNTSPKVRTMLENISSKLAGLNLAQVSKDASGIFSTLTTTLGDVNDPAAAEAALPKLRDVSSQLDQLKRTHAQMSPGGKSMIAKIINAARGPLNKLIAQVLTTLGADATLVKPVLDEIVTKLTGIAPPAA